MAKKKATIKEIEKFLEDNEISGILKVGTGDVISLYKDHATFLEIIDFADIEEAVYARKKEAIINDEITMMKSNSKQFKPIPTYIK